MNFFIFQSSLLSNALETAFFYVFFIAIGYFLCDIELSLPFIFLSLSITLLLSFYGRIQKEHDNGILEHRIANETGLEGYLDNYFIASILSNGSLMFMATFSFYYSNNQMFPFWQLLLFIPACLTLTVMLDVLNISQKLKVLPTTLFLFSFLAPFILLSEISLKETSAFYCFSALSLSVIGLSYLTSQWSLKEVYA